MKEWIVSNQKWIGFKSCSKVICKMCVQYDHECWKRRFVVLHEPEVQRKVLQDEVLSIIEEASKVLVEGLRRCIKCAS